MLEGKKTYITAVVLALASFARAMGWLSRTIPNDLGTGGSLGLAALRAGMARCTGIRLRKMDRTRR